MKNNYIFKINLMESIVAKSINDSLINHQCSLNQFGRKRYGSIFDLIITKSGVKSTVGVGNGNNIIMEDKRKSKHYRSACTFTFDKTDIIDAFKNLAPEDRKTYVQWLPPDHMCDVIEYLPGDFFVAHRDRKNNRLHYATLLIFPPALDELAHTGGELIITRKDGSKFTFESSLNKHWTFIAFHQELEHECRVVTSGRRLVIKTELTYKYFRTLRAPDVRDDLYNDYPIMDGNLPRFDQEINEMMLEDGTQRY